MAWYLWGIEEFVTSSGGWNVFVGNLLSYHVQTILDDWLLAAPDYIKCRLSPARSPAICPPWGDSVNVGRLGLQARVWRGRLPGQEASSTMPAVPAWHRPPCQGLQGEWMTTPLRSMRQSRVAVRGRCLTTSTCHSQSMPLTGSPKAVQRLKPHSDGCLGGSTECRSHCLLPCTSCCCHVTMVATAVSRDWHNWYATMRSLSKSIRADVNRLF